MDKQPKLFRSEQKEREYDRHYGQALEKWPVSKETFYIKTAYGDTFVIRCGQKINPPLVLLHCQGFSSIAWLYNVEELSKHFEIFCVDSIGEPGRSRCNRTKASNTDLATWLKEVIDQMGLKQPNIAGWSFGGFIALQYAMRYPGDIGKLVLLSPAASIAPLAYTFYLKLFPALFSGKDTKINSFLKWISGNDNHDFPNPTFTVFTMGMKSFQGWLRGIKLVVFAEGDFQRIRVPTLLLIGEDDPIYRKTAPVELARKMNAVRSTLIAETVPGKHGFPILNAELVNRKMIGFLQNEF